MTPALDAELGTSVLQAPQQRVQALLEELGGDGERAAGFDPYALFGALDRERVGYVVDRRLRPGRARKRRDDPTASTSSPRCERRTCAASPVRSRRSRPRRGGKPIRPEQLASTRAADGRGPGAGELMVVPMPWGTRGYDDLRIRAFRDNLGRGVRPAVASTRRLRPHARQRANATPTTNASSRLRRLMELERQLVPQPRRTIER